MADWRKLGRISGDVVFFEYVTSKLERTSEVIYLWDIDKTYLDTHFESLKGLIKTAFEKAFQKKNVPGTRVLVRSLTGASEASQSKPFPIYFISASPPQMERKIRLKLELDGINPYGAFFKDNLRNLSPKYFRRLTQQVGFKLQALLELRMRLKEDVRQVLFGDDSESDAVVYSLYSDICARRIEERPLRRVLDELHVIPSQQDAILDLQKRVPEQDPVEKVYINLANDTDPDYYEKFGRRLLPTYNTFQMAVDLFQDGRLSEFQLQRVAQDMVLNYGFTADELSTSMTDMVQRKRLLQRTTDDVIRILKSQRLLGSSLLIPASTISDMNQIKVAGEWIPAHIDYSNDFR
jgi:hypothetical protein